MHLDVCLHACVLHVKERERGGGVTVCTACMYDLVDYVF